MERSILDLSYTELKDIKDTKTLPSDVTLKGIEERADFDTLYRFRQNPSALASYLLKEKKKTENTEEKLSIKKAELDLRSKKQTGQTAVLKDLKSHLTRLETKLDFLIQTATQNQNKKEI